MSESDSGVDTGSESNESNSMSVESPPRLEDDKDCINITERPNLPSTSHQQTPTTFGSRQSMYCSYSYSEYRQHDHTSKMKPCLQRKVFEYKSKVYPKYHDFLGERKLQKAIFTNSVEQVKNLLDMGVDPCSSDERQRTPLHFAACYAHPEIARLLIERGADANQRDILGNTPLHLAACTSHIEMVTLLLKAGTDVNAFNNSGRSPLQLAQSKLKLLQANKNCSSSQLKTEVMHILEMMQVYMQRSGQTAEIDLMYLFSTRLHHHQTREEVTNDVSDLLSSLSHLNLHKA